MTSDDVVVKLYTPNQIAALEEGHRFVETPDEERARLLRTLCYWKQQAELSFAEIGDLKELRGIYRSNASFTISYREIVAEVTRLRDALKRIDAVSSMERLGSKVDLTESLGDIARAALEHTGAKTP